MWGSTRSSSEQLGFFYGGYLGEQSEQLGALGATPTIVLTP